MERLAVILAAYFDESGTDEGSKTIAFAGWISTPEQWVVFERQWKKALREFDIEFFRMSKFAQRAPPYDGWAEKVRRARFRRLLDIINENIIGSVGVVIDGKKYHETFPVKAHERVGGPYGLLTAASMIELSNVLRRIDVDASIAYIFESGAKGAGQVLKTFQQNVADPETRDHFRLRSLTFENKRDFLPLQAADILAYELYLHLPRQLGANLRAPRMFSLTSLGRAPHSWTYLGGQELRKWSRLMSLDAS